MRKSAHRRQIRLVCLGCCWAALVGFSLPATEPRLDYHLTGLVDEVLTAPTRSRAAIAAPKLERAQWRLTVDTSIVADSNVTNSTNEHSISTFQGDLVLPVPLDPSLRAHSSTGLGVAMAGGVDFSLAKDVLLTINAEGYMLDQEGETNDDVSLLMAAGPNFAWSGGEASAQLVAFERWYGGISASAGFGLRGRYKEQLAPGQNIILSVDARVFESDYGEEFGGTQAGLYLAYNDVLNEITTGSIGIFVRRDWLDGEAYSSRELGAYGGLSRYIGSAFTGSITAGISTILFDAPVAFPSPEPRQDMRVYASASLTTRKPIGWGVHPSLGYTYNWTRSSIGFFEAQRHRLRFALWRNY